MWSSLNSLLLPLTHYVPRCTSHRHAFALKCAAVWRPLSAPRCTTRPSRGALRSRCLADTRTRLCGGGCRVLLQDVEVLNGGRRRVLEFPVAGLAHWYRGLRHVTRKWHQAVNATRAEHVAAPPAVVLQVGKAQEA